MRLERYNEYKISLSAVAKSKRFLPSEQGHHVTFFIPVPKTWRRHKKESAHLQLHTSTPDLDNLYKAYLDAMLAEDKHIADVRLTKRWVNQENGWIEIVIFEPDIPSRDNLM